MSEFDALPANIKSRFIGALSLANKAKNANEAATAAGMVQAMMLKYSISLEDVGAAEAKKNNTPIDPFAGMTRKTLFFSGSNRDINMGILAGTLCEFMFCKAVWSKFQQVNTDIWVNGLNFFGKTEDVEMVIALFNKLRFAMNDITDKKFAEYKQSKFFEKVHGKEWKSQFQLGMMSGIYTQMKKNYQEFQNSRFMKLEGGGYVGETEYNGERLQLNSGGPQMGLMVIGKELTVTKEKNADDFMKSVFGKVTGAKEKAITQYDAYIQGYEAGKKMQIREEIA